MTDDDDYIEPYPEWIMALSWYGALLFGLVFWRAVIWWVFGW